MKYTDVEFRRRCLPRGTLCSMNPSMKELWVVGLAASTGGLKALTAILAAFPADSPVAFVVVKHIGTNVSLLPELLARQTKLHVKEAEEGDILQPGCVYIAPPDRHVVVRPGGTLALSQSAKVHFTRPAAEPLFESLAISCKDRAIAVVLTGGGSDGSNAVRVIKQNGGTVLAQDEASSEDWGMPQAAIQTGCVDEVLPLDRIADSLLRHVGRA